MDYCPSKADNQCCLVPTILVCFKQSTPNCQESGLERFKSDPFFLQDNARVHTTKVSMAKLRELKWQLLPHPAYSPDLAPSDFHPFGLLKDPLRDRSFGCESELKSAINEVVKTMPKDWFEERIKVTERWRKCIDLQGDYTEK